MSGLAGPKVNPVPKVEQDTNFEVISVTVGPRAYCAVGPPTTGTYVTITPAEAPSKGPRYSAANGSVIRNCGQRVVTGRAEEGTLVSMPIQVADVKKVLGPAREMVDAGNRIVLDKDSNGKCVSYLECKVTGIKTAIHERNGTVQFDAEVPKGSGGE